MHAASRTEAKVRVLNLPKVFARRPKAVDRINLVAFFQPFCFRIATGLYCRDITLVTNHFHAPAVFSFAGPSRRKKESVRVIKVNQGLSDDAEDLIYGSGVLDLFVSRLEPRFQV